MKFKYASNRMARIGAQDVTRTMLDMRGGAQGALNCLPIWVRQAELHTPDSENTIATIEVLL